MNTAYDTDTDTDTDTDAYDDFHIETAAFPAVVFLQAGRRVAGKLLRANGYHIAEQGYTDDSTTQWFVAFAVDAEGEEPADEDVAERAQELLWENGFGYVESTTIAVER